MVVETILSMLTYVCDFKRTRHKVWDYFSAKPINSPIVLRMKLCYTLRQQIYTTESAGYEP